MMKSIQSHNVSLAPTTKFESNFFVDEKTTSDTTCLFYNFPPQPEPQLPADFSTIDSMVKEWEQDADLGTAMNEARKWVADSYYKDDTTVRSLRLHKGLSQAHLAELLGTSQSHVARIEKGTENPLLGTVRKLAQILEVDLNTLDMALKRQETFLNSKKK